MMESLPGFMKMMEFAMSKVGSLTKRIEQANKIRPISRPITG